MFCPTDFLMEPYNYNPVPFSFRFFFFYVIFFLIISVDKIFPDLTLTISAGLEINSKKKCISTIFASFCCLICSFYITLNAWSDYLWLFLVALFHDWLCKMWIHMEEKELRGTCVMEEKNKRDMRGWRKKMEKKDESLWRAEKRWKLL